MTSKDPFSSPSGRGVWAQEIDLNDELENVSRKTDRAATDIGFDMV